MIVEIANTEQPKLRWQPGVVAPMIIDGLKQSTGQEWQSALIENMKLDWWVKGELAK